MVERIDAIYARQSVDKIDSISIESQIDFCRYETRGEPYRVFQDKGYSGKNTDRPAFRQMRNAIRNGEIKRVICYKLDRCSRSILDFTTLMEEFQTYGVEFVSCTEKFDTSTPMGRAMLNICIVFAQLERETIQQRVSDAYHSRNIKGFYMGGRVPFGFRLEPFYLDGKKTSRYTINKEEAIILKKMYLTYESAFASLGDVVKMLEEEGIRHPRKKDGCWTRTHIGRMLYNPIYVKADLDVFRYFKEYGAVIHNDPEEFIGTNGCYLYSEKGNANSGCVEGQHLVLAPHQGIISSDVWLRCRKKKKTQGQTNRQYGIKNTWLAGKIKCAKCGYALVVQKTTKKDKTFRYIVCSGANKGGKKCDGIRGVRADCVEELVFDEIAKKLEYFSSLSAPKQRRTHSEISELKVKIVQLAQEIEKTAAKALETSGTLLTYLEERAEQLNAQKKMYEVRLREQMAISRGKSSPGLDYIPIWKRLTMEDRIMVVNALIDKIQISETEVAIFWTLGIGS